MTEVKPTLI